MLGGMRIFIFLPVLGFFYTADAAITAWTTPSVSGADVTGTLSVAEDQALNTEITAYVATSGGTVDSYTLVEAVSPFALSTGGSLTITSALDKETTSAYTLKVKALDDVPGSGTATITVTVTNVDEPPVYASASVGTTVADESGSGTTVTTQTATDPEGDTITYSIFSGNTNSDFAIGSSNAVITVANKLDRSTTSAYVLVIHAIDAAGSAETGSTTLAIVVTDGAASIVASVALTLLMGFFTLIQ